MSVDGKEIIARRVAREIPPGALVNLGIGLPTQVAAFLPPGRTVFFQTENGLAGVGPRPARGMENPNLVDAGGGFITAIPGAAAFDSTFSFGLIRGGHIDVTVLGGLQVDTRGRLANWMIPGTLVPGMGGGMDLATGAKRVIVAMIHRVRGVSKIVEECSLPLTSIRPISLVVTDLAVLEPTTEGLLLRERAPGVTIDEILDGTAARLLVPDEVPEMVLESNGHGHARR
jgi:acetate CoA/acetoacetate CoA-transferase beta subunit